MRTVVVAAILLAASSALATTVRHTELPELVSDSQIIVRAHVSFVDDRAGEVDGKFQTRVGFEVDEAVKGVDGQMLEVVLPGGKSHAYTMRIPGMPTFKPGDEVVVLVHRTAGGDSITGLGQGIFKVDRSSGTPRVSQPFIESIHVLDAQGRAVRSAATAVSLDALMGQLRAYSAGGAQ